MAAEVMSPEFRKLLEALDEQEHAFLSMLKERGLKSLFLFNKYILMAEKGDDNFTKLGKFHKELCNFVQDRPDKRKLILIPRAHLKTKLISVGYSTFKIVNNPKIRILIVSATSQMANDIHMTIQKNLQMNERILSLVGDLTEGASIWTQDRTKLAANDKREATITAAGITTNLVGGHYDLIIFDDVVSRENVQTMNQIQKVVIKYKDALDLLEPHGELLVVGTRWHDSDLYGWIIDPSTDVIQNYMTMILQAYEGNIMTGQDFKPLWEGKFDLNGLRKILREEGWSHFSSQYMNDPVPEEDAIFKRDWFRYYIQDDIRGKLMNKFLLIDPAISQSKEADYTAMVVVGVDEYRNVFILDIIRSRLSPNDINNQIFRLRDLWNLNDIGIEEISFQKTLGYSLREDERFKLRPFHITTLKPGDRSKDMRIKGLQPLYENGKIFHNKSLPNNIYLEDELVRFPRSTHDDVCDALAYVTDVMYPARQAMSRRSSGQKYLYR